ncbi:protein transporter Sec31 [Streptomyces sp. DSM 41524]|uniref:Protein transporter Sec31 n=1 Tax=Streptomyces asiaticus subsp. ignotus TaxID=3098222 RepID=A0ABU7QA17_9ACTN|nr:protein transporter Sec31 [Streptomyces sp. DSM 41524]
MKTRTVWRTREVPHTEAGETRLIPEDYPVEIPVPPRDWDHIVLNAVTAIAIGLTVVSVAWSTVSGGALLDRAAPAAAAYPAALVYDAAWITCMALEWLARYDPDRARAPRIAGYVALAIAMGAIATHGCLDAGKAVGVAGAAISAIAKGLWQLVLNHTAQPLPARTQKWLNVRRGEVGAQLALAAQQRQLTRMQERHAAMLAAYGMANPDTDPDADTNPDPGPGTVRPIRPSVREAVRTAYASGIEDPAKVLAYVHKVADPDARPDTVDRYLRGIRRSA